MATSYKILGTQLAPGTTAQATLYSPTGTNSAIVSTITICNRGATAGTYRIAVQASGATLANQHYIAYDTAIAANDTVALTLGITLYGTDILSVAATSGSLSFSAFGTEIS